MDRKYFTKFELMSESEKRFFKRVGIQINNLRNTTTENTINLGKKVIDIYRSTPTFIKAGGLVALSVMGTIGIMHLIKEEKSEERVYIQYRIENAPHSSPTYASEFVNMKRLKEIRSDPYYTILKEN